MRFASWINEADRTERERDFASIQAGFSGFVGCASYADKGLREFFAEQIDSSLKTFSEDDVRLVASYLEPPAQAFLNQIWRKAQGRRTVAQVANVTPLMKRLVAALGAKEFNPSEMATVVGDAQRATAGDPEVTGLFAQNAAPIVKKLSARQREDVMGWLKSGEKAFFKELLR